MSLHMPTVGDVREVPSEPLRVAAALPNNCTDAPERVVIDAEGVTHLPVWSGTHDTLCDDETNPVNWTRLSSVWGDVKLCPSCLRTLRRRRDAPDWGRY